MKNIDWFDVFFTVSIVVVIAAVFGCTIVPLFVRAAIDMWTWALA